MLHAEEVKISKSAYIQPLDSATENALSNTKSKELTRHQEIIAEVEAQKKEFSYLESAELKDGKINFIYNNGSSEKDIVSIEVTSLVGDDSVACCKISLDCGKIYDDRVYTEAPRPSESPNLNTFVGCYETLDDLTVGIKQPKRGMIVVVSGQMFIYDGSNWVALGRMSASVVTTNCNVDHISLNITERKQTSFKVKDTRFATLTTRKKRNLYKV